MIVREFLIWIEQAPAPRRAEVAHALARAYLYGEVDDDETRSEMEAALTLLLDDESSDVRLALADRRGCLSRHRSRRHDRRRWREQWRGCLGPGIKRNGPLAA